MPKKVTQLGKVLSWLLSRIYIQPDYAICYAIARYAIHTYPIVELSKLLQLIETDWFTHTECVSFINTDDISVYRIRMCGIPVMWKQNCRFWEIIMYVTNFGYLEFRLHGRKESGPQNFLYPKSPVFAATLNKLLISYHIQIVDLNVNFFTTSGSCLEYENSLGFVCFYPKLFFTFNRKQENLVRQTCSLTFGCLCKLLECVNILLPFTQILSLFCWSRCSLWREIIQLVLLALQLLSV